MSEETGRHQVYLDGWRGCAIAAVLAGHFVLDDIMPKFGIFGVQLFFVLSGRLMAEILFIRCAELDRFYLRRFSRVYPALFVFVVLSAVLFSRAGGGYGLGLRGAVSALTFTINYAMLYSHTVLLLDHLWSLCVEEHGYLILSVIALASRRAQAPVTLLLGVLWLIATINGIVRVDVLGGDTLHVLWRSDVSVAMIASAAWMRMFMRDRRPSPYLCPILFAVGCILCLGDTPFWAGFGLGTLCLSAAVVLIDDRSILFGRTFSSPILGQLGRMSFSLYLWQQPFYKLMRYGAASGWILAPAALLAGMASFRFVEQPARRTINNLFDDFRAQRS